MQGLPIGCIVEASLFCSFAVFFRFQSGSVSCPSIFSYVTGLQRRLSSAAMWHKLSFRKAYLRKIFNFLTQNCRHRTYSSNLKLGRYHGPQTNENSTTFTFRLLEPNTLSALNLSLSLLKPKKFTLLEHLYLPQCLV
jgi:hypothetical protein